MALENYVTAKIGEVAGFMHTGKSKNDQVATDLRLILKEEIEEIEEDLLNFIETIIKMASDHTETVMVGYTHLQHAQPTTFAHHLMVKVWTNLRLNPPTRYGPWFYRGIGRLKPGVTIEQAQAETDDIGLRMAQENPDYKRVKLPVVRLRDAMLGTTLRPAILVLCGAVGLVLLIAVVNVANPTLARATVREREMALRLSLGAGRGRLVRQLLAESVLLAMMGGAAGLALAWGGIERIRAWNPGDLPFMNSVRLDWMALAFMLLVSVFPGILFGIARRHWRARGQIFTDSPRRGAHRLGDSLPGRSRRALVICELAMTLMLTGAGLLFRSFTKLQQVNGGFSAPPERLVILAASLGNRKYNDARLGPGFLRGSAPANPHRAGVELAAVTRRPTGRVTPIRFRFRGKSFPRGGRNPIVTAATVDPAFFQAPGILVRGPRIHGPRYGWFGSGGHRERGFCASLLSQSAGHRKRIAQSGPDGS